MKKPTHYGSKKHTTAGVFSLLWKNVTCALCLDFHRHQVKLSPKAFESWRKKQAKRKGVK